MRTKLLIQLVHFRQWRSGLCAPTLNRDLRVIPIQDRQIARLRQKDATTRNSAGLSDHVWTLEEIVEMADSYMPKPGKRGPYNKNQAA
jgi:hypothetical protein